LVSPRIFIGLGANLGDAEETLGEAAEEISRLPGTTPRGRSSLWATAPLGPAQPEFRNAVLEVGTSLDPQALLSALLGIERAHGRERGERWGPRLLDLDLLLWGEDLVERSGLRIPHPEMHRRRFVLEPLAELAPDLVHPISQKTIVALLETVRDQAVRRLSSPAWGHR
jgi:2-amino-4-hydroxy-6-hydroxymethyldihydropteridine diphosphokinase